MRSFKMAYLYDLKALPIKNAEFRQLDLLDIEAPSDSALLQKCQKLTKA